MARRGRSSGRGGKNAQAGNVYKAYRLLGVRKRDPSLYQRGFWYDLYIMDHGAFERVWRWMQSMTPAQRPGWVRFLREVKEALD